MATTPSHVEDLERRAVQLQPDVERTARQAEEILKLRRVSESLVHQANLIWQNDLGEVVSRLERDLQSLHCDLSTAQGLPVDEPSLMDVRWTTPSAPDHEYGKRSLSSINILVVEHTATLEDTSPVGLATTHLGQGKPGIACHFLIGRSGRIYWTQPLEIAVAHSLDADLNRNSIAVSLAGNFNGEAPGEAQLEATADLLAWLVSLFGLDLRAIRGRRELEVVSSPGAQWMRGANYKDTLLAMVQARLDGHPGAHPTGVRGSGELTTQTAARVPKPQVLDVVDSLPRHPTLAPYPKRTTPISAVAIHHTDTGRTTNVQQLAQYHVYGIRKDAKGNATKAEWPGIGYHFVIAPDGIIYQTQREQTRSYHVGSQGNDACLGIAFVGRFMQYGYDGKLQQAEDQIPTPAQLRSGGHLVAWLMQEFDIAPEKVLGHKDVVGAATACPGEHWEAGLKWRRLLQQEIQRALDPVHKCNAEQPLEHFLLFWDNGTSWAERDWQDAQDYIAHFRPTTGFSVQDALQARHVTIVGSTAGVSASDEARLDAACVQVYRLAGATQEATKAMLDDLVAKNTPWLGALPGNFKAVQEVEPLAISGVGDGDGYPTESDEWTAPENREQSLTQQAEPSESEFKGE